MKTKDEILEQKTPISKVFGIYFLIRRNEIVYVGQSINAEQRIGSYLAEGTKVFDSYTVHNCKGLSQEELNDLEAYYILRFSPQYNGNLPANGRYKSVPQLKEIFGVTAWVVKRWIRENNIRPAGFHHYTLKDFEGIQ